MINETAQKNGMATAALVFGILALLGSVVILPTPLFAGLAITFAFLSRGNRKMCGTAKAGNIMALISIVISIIAIGVLVAAGLHYLGNVLAEAAEILSEWIGWIIDYISVNFGPEYAEQFSRLFF